MITVIFQKVISASNQNVYNKIICMLYIKNFTRFQPFFSDILIKFRQNQQIKILKTECFPNFNMKTKSIVT